ncbi:helix-turn-helix domain-containing protein [Streptomyces coeruleorubidus]|uniref:helix-turn-helix domain-containing protein n=1 Tax=Streptomyces coeruleorubidus TaxID=116188 RepID=UPI0037B818AF
MRPEIERVVEIIRDRYAEPLTLTRLSEEAGLSRFHMARLFSVETGLPPGHYQTAVRLEHARWNLLHTSDSIADISLQVGYASLGTFTTRFTKVTGVSPGRYRRLSDLGSETAAFTSPSLDAPFGYGSVVGHIERSDGLLEEPLYVAAFPADTTGPRPGTRPARCCRVARSDRLWRLPHVPEGRWSVQAVSRTLGRPGLPVAVASSPPIQVTPGSVTHITLDLRPTWRTLPSTPHDFPFVAAARLPEMFRT